MQLFDRPRAAVEAQTMPPAPAEHARDANEFPAHRQLVDALLQAGGPGKAGPSYAVLWQQAAAEQESWRPAPEGVIERSLELLVTELRALASAVTWFDAVPSMRDAAISESIAYWAGDLGVPSAAAHVTWKQCWESRARAMRRLPLDHDDVTATVEFGQRLNDEWLAHWERWADSRI